MQTIVRDGGSLYLFADNATLSISDESITTPDFVISDCNSANSVVYQGATPPADWAANKYCFDGTNWALNPLWVDQNAEKRKQQEAARAEAYRTESDPIFFMSQRGEATMEEWVTKVAEIKARYPYPTE
jgi:hypothetical protein